VEKGERQLVRQGKLEFVKMANKQKHYDQTRDPRTGRPPFPIDVERARKPNTSIEGEEDENLEVNETSKATEGVPEIPENTGGEPKVVRQQVRLNDPVDEDEVEPEAIDEQMRNQDA
jgi:hypothetical protein